MKPIAALLTFVLELYLWTSVTLAGVVVRVFGL
jgi:hypothetical protein